MLINLTLFTLGLIMLYHGAGWLVKGASDLAQSLGVQPILIGLTIVAFGTSAPELVISVVSSFQGKSMIAVGNVVGSNICNIALVLGLTAILHPVVCSKTIIKREIPIMLGISFFLLLISLNSTIGRLEGIMLFSGVILYIYLKYYIAVKTSKRYKDTCGNNTAVVNTTIREDQTLGRPKQILLIITGILVVIFGAEILIDSAIKIMKSFGVSETFIGLTIVAFGTSLPELATSVVAALKKESDISIGNLIGSNVFNILSVIGVAAMVNPIKITGGFIKNGLIIDYLVMMFTSFLPLVLMRKTNAIQRRQGFILLGVYICYLVFLIIRG